MAYDLRLDHIIDLAEKDFSYVLIFYLGDDEAEVLGWKEDILVEDCANFLEFSNKRITLAVLFRNHLANVNILHQF